jgi:hypothetical protein
MTGEHGDEIAYWHSPAPARADSPAAKLAVSGDLVAAEVAADGPGSLEVADVIYCGGEPGREQPLASLVAVLRNYPGCAVTAIRMADDGCLVLSRSDPPLIFSPFMKNEQGFSALVCAMFVHGWLAAGWPLNALDPPQLEAAAGFSPPAMPISFGMYYEGSPPGPSSASRRCISSASGAPMSE